MTDNRPLIGITMGDPTGIGPEILARALAREDLRAIARMVVVGDAEVMRRAVALTGTGMVVRQAGKPDEARFKPGEMDVIDIGLEGLASLPYGQVSALAGQASFCCVRDVIELALSGSLAATVTGPINKEALKLAGHPFAGHTEIYAHLTGTERYGMMLQHGSLRVVHVSTHCSLREACSKVTRHRVLETIRLADEACRSLGIEHPRIGVAGLNPHAGENGLFGHEELDDILPAVMDAQHAGLSAEGPLPADTLFSKVQGGMYDIAVAMYHDQGHIPLKLAGFRWDSGAGKWLSVSGVNITLGLPIIRCSVDHGTAFDVAGKGIATEESLACAIEVAVKMVYSSNSHVPAASGLLAPASADKVR